MFYLQTGSGLVFGVGSFAMPYLKESDFCDAVWRGGEGSKSAKKRDVIYGRPLTRTTRLGLGIGRTLNCACILNMYVFVAVLWIYIHAELIFISTLQLRSLYAEMQQNCL